MKPDPSQAEPPQPNLRQKVLQGAAFLVARQGLGIVINTVCLMVLLWLIGPSEYGLFTAAVAFNFILTYVAKSGVHIYLVRRPDPVDHRDYHQAFTLFLLTGFAGVSLTWLALPLLDRWMGMEGFRWVAFALCGGLPLALLALVPTVKLERELEYRRITSIELLAQLLYQAVTLTLASIGWGAFSMVAGWWAQHLASAALLYFASGYRPRLLWERDRIRTMVAYGVSYAASQSIWKSRSLVAPLVVGPLLGPAALGYLSLAGRLADLLCFVKDVGWRLSISALARVQNDQQRLLNALSDGIQLQILSIAPFLAAFGLVAPVLLPWIPSERAAEWAPAIEIFPFIALAHLVHGAFNLPISALYLRTQNRAVGACYFLNLLCFAVGAWVLVPRLGLIGFVTAEVIACVAFVLIHLRTNATIGRLDYGVTWVWVLGFGLVPFWPYLGWAAGLGVAAVVMWPRSWAVLGAYTRQISSNLLPRLRRPIDPPTVVAAQTQP